MNFIRTYEDVYASYVRIRFVIRTRNRTEFLDFLEIDPNYFRRIALAAGKYLILLYMINSTIKSIAIAILLISAGLFFSCKQKTDNSTTDNKTVSKPQPAMQKTLKDIYKDSLVIINKSAKLEKANPVSGKFISVMEGDYQHLVMKAGGDTLSFWLYDYTDEDWLKLKAGDKIKVNWKKERNYIPEAGDTIEMDVATKIEKIK
jgi:hypothetical protein